MEIDPAHSHLCEKERKKIENQFKRGACMPWLPESRLKAEIQKSQWETRRIIEVKRLGGDDFDRLCFGDAGIRIMEGVALLEAARFSKSPKLKEVFHLLGTEEPWWVVEFFEHDSSDNKRLPFDWKQRAVRSFFYPPTREWSVTRPSERLLIKDYIFEEANRVSRMEGVRDAFCELSKLPSMWNTRTFTYLSDIRKSFCHEEAENYIWAIVNQWREITLQWDPRILQCVDFKSVNTLQSRAPALSTEDLNCIKDEFGEGRILPLLKDPKLRGRVESVICCQGPILTLETFAEDARLLQLRVREPLKKLLPNMKGSGDTLRKKICDLLDKEFDKISGSNGHPKPTNEERQALIKRCYQHVFLHTIRTRTPITAVDLRNLMEKELCIPCTQDRGTMSTEAPENELPDIEADIEKRHGDSLFKDVEATKNLYYDRINNSGTSSPALTQSYMAIHIVRIFLFGREAVERTKAPTSGSPVATIQSLSTQAHPISFDVSPISACSSEELGRSQNFPTCMAGLTISNARRVCQEHIQTPAALVNSMAASLASNELSPTTSTHTSTTKRSASIDGLLPVKRRRSWFDHQEQNIILRDTGDPHYQRGSPSVSDLLSQATGMVSPSVYSQADERSSICQTGSVRLRSNSDLGNDSRLLIAKDYSELIGRWEELNHGESQSHTDVASSYTEAMAVPRHPTSKPRPKTSDNVATYEPLTVGSHTGLPTYVWYISIRDRKKALRVPRTEQATYRFVATQKEVDKKARFSYELKGSTKYASDAEQLYTAINRRELLTVWVHSNSLGKP